MTNVRIAALLDEVAGVLEAQDANPFRVGAYRRAAETVRTLDRDVAAIVAEGGVEALEALPAIGVKLARTIAQAAETGTIPMLDRLRGTADPIALLATVPGVGRRLAQRLHDAAPGDDVEPVLEDDDEAVGDLHAEQPELEGRRLAVRGLLGVKRAGHIHERIDGGRLVAQELRAEA